MPYAKNILTGEMDGGIVVFPLMIIYYFQDSFINSAKEIIMSSEKATPPAALLGTQIARSFEQSPDAISFYCDFANVVATGNEVVMQLYETIPGVPDHEGKITKAVSRLRATITLSVSHAQNLGKVLVEKTKVQLQ
ncbi:MAG: hypothetical protein WAK96_03915 [Desulfobaccales bacterium]